MQGQEAGRQSETGIDEKRSRKTVERETNIVRGSNPVAGSCKQ